MARVNLWTVAVFVVATVLVSAQRTAAQTPPCPPNQPDCHGTPQNLQATVAGNLLTLTWTNSTKPPAPNAANRIEAGSTPNFTSPLATIDIPVNQSSFQVPAPIGTFFLRVRRVGTGELAEPSNEVRADINSGAPPPPGVPGTIVANVVNSNVRLSWAAAPGVVTRYLLEAGTGPSLSNLGVVPVQGTLFTIGGVPPGTYFLRVRAQGPGGTSPPTADTVITTSTGCTPPSAPRGLTSVVGGNRVRLSWSGPASGSSPFNFILGAGTGPGLNNIGVTPVGSLTALEANVPNGTYYVRVAASNACGTGPASNEVAFVAGTTRDPDVVFAEALALYNSGRIVEAKILFQEVTVLDPGRADPYYFVGLIEVNIGNPRGAVPWLQAYLQRAPNGQYAANARQLLLAILALP